MVSWEGASLGVVSLYPSLGVRMNLRGPDGWVNTPAEMFQEPYIVSS